MDKAEIEKILENNNLYAACVIEGFGKQFLDITTKEIASSLTSLIIKWLEGKKDGYARGLCEQIGSLLMASEGMREGFKEYKSLKEIERQRNIGYNQLITELVEEMK